MVPPAIDALPSNPCKLEEIIPPEDWFVHDRDSINRYWTVGPEPLFEIRDHVGAEEGPSVFTLSDLVSLLHALPRPDDEYLEAVEQIMENQPMLPGSPWEC